jgi:hypothetical protein
LCAIHVRMAGHYGDDRAPLCYRGHGVVVDKAGRIPQHVAGIGAHQLSPLSDSERRRTADCDESVLDDRDLRPRPFGSQLFQRRPLLPFGWHPLPVVGANRADVRRGGVLDTAGSAQPKHAITLRPLWSTTDIV